MKGYLIGYTKWFISCTTNKENLESEMELRVFRNKVLQWGYKHNIKSINFFKKSQLKFLFTVPIQSQKSELSCMLGVYILCLFILFLIVFWSYSDRCMLFIVFHFYYVSHIS